MLNVKEVQLLNLVDLVRSVPLEMEILQNQEPAYLVISVIVQKGAEFVLNVEQGKKHFPAVLVLTVLQVMGPKWVVCALLVNQASLLSRVEVVLIAHLVNFLILEVYVEIVVLVIQALVVLILVSNAHMDKFLSKVVNV